MDHAIRAGPAGPWCGEMAGGQLVKLLGAKRLREIETLRHRAAERARAAAHRVCGRGARLAHQLDDQIRREAVRLVQVPQVRLCQEPPGAELGQQLAAPGEQVCEPAFLAAEHVANHAVFLALAELRLGLLDQRRRQIIQRPGAVWSPEHGVRTPQQPAQYVAPARIGLVTPSPMITMLDRRWSVSWRSDA